MQLNDSQRGIIRVKQRNILQSGIRQNDIEEESHSAQNIHQNDIQQTYNKIAIGIMTLC